MLPMIAEVADKIPSVLDAAVMAVCASGVIAFWGFVYKRSVGATSPIALLANFLLVNDSDIFHYAVEEVGPIAVWYPMILYNASILITTTIVCLFAPRETMPLKNIASCDDGDPSVGPWSARK